MPARSAVLPTAASAGSPFSASAPSTAVPAVPIRLSTGLSPAIFRP